MRTGMPGKSLGMMLMVCPLFLHHFEVSEFGSASESTMFKYAFFFLGSRFITYDAINIKDHYFWGICGSHLMFLSGALPWVGF